MFPSHGNREKCTSASPTRRNLMISSRGSSLMTLNATKKPDPGFLFSRSGLMTFATAKTLMESSRFWVLKTLEKRKKFRCRGSGEPCQRQKSCGLRACSVLRDLLVCELGHEFKARLDLLDGLCLEDTVCHCFCPDCVTDLRPDKDGGPAVGAANGTGGDIAEVCNVVEAYVAAGRLVFVGHLEWQ